MLGNMDLGTHPVIAALPGAQALGRDMTSDFSRRLVAVIFRNPALLRHQLAVHSDSEREGAEFVFDVCKTVPDASLQNQLSDHANDELKHSRIYAALSERIKSVHVASLPGDFVTPADDTRESFNGSMIRFFMSLHVAEIRNRILLDVYLDEIDAIADPKTRRRAEAAIRTIREDECRHVSSTLPFVMHGLDTAAITYDDLDKAFCMFRSLFWTETAATLKMAGQLIPFKTDQRKGSGIGQISDKWLAANVVGTCWLHLTISQVNDDVLELISLCDAPREAIKQVQRHSAAEGWRSGDAGSLNAGFLATTNLIWQKVGTDRGSVRCADLVSIEQCFPRRQPGSTDFPRIHSFAQSLWSKLAEATESLARQC